MYLLTRRCTQRQFLLKPSPKTNAIFLYCLALAAEKTGVLVHAVCVLSNHYHAVITDVHGNLPEFTAHLNKYVAKCVNASLGRWENLWASEQPSQVALIEDADALKRLVYTLSNPTESLLVDHSERWPGVRTTPQDMLRGPIEVPRPGVFFRPDGPTPEVATLEITRPAIYRDLDDQAFVTKLEQAIKDREQEIRGHAMEKGIPFLGLRKLLAQDTTDTPRTIEPRRNLKPRVAAANKWSRIEALQRLKSFIRDYREAWTRWKAGLRDTLFPPGTYALVRHAGVGVAPG
jgi:REP element-mobilizing transposase RayT